MRQGAARRKAAAELKCWSRRSPQEAHLHPMIGSLGTNSDCWCKRNKAARGAIPANSDDDQLRELILAGIEQCQLEGLDQKER